MKDIEACPVCGRCYTKRNYRVNAHLKYNNPEETEFTCRNCNTAEYYYRHPEKYEMKSAFWKWWWKKRIRIVMEYYKKNRIILKVFKTTPMKSLKFASHLVEKITSGEKTSTWRLFDD